MQENIEMRLVCVGNQFFFFAVKYIEKCESGYFEKGTCFKTQGSRYLDDMYRLLLNREY